MENARVGSLSKQSGKTTFGVGVEHQHTVGFTRRFAAAAEGAFWNFWVTFHLHIWKRLYAQC